MTMQYVARRRITDNELLEHAVAKGGRSRFVYLTAEGYVHGRCNTALSTEGIQNYEMTFYCLECLEHVLVPVDVLDDLPVMAKQKV